MKCRSALQLWSLLWSVSVAATAVSAPQVSILHPSAQQTVAVSEGQQTADVSLQYSVSSFTSPSGHPLRVCFQTFRVSSSEAPYGPEACFASIDDLTVRSLPPGTYTVRASLGAAPRVHPPPATSLSARASGPHGTVERPQAPSDQKAHPQTLATERVAAHSDSVTFTVLPLGTATVAHDAATSARAPRARSLASSREAFWPRYEWQVLPPGADVPAGLEVTLPMDGSGRKRARIPPTWRLQLDPGVTIGYFRTDVTRGTTVHQVQEAAAAFVAARHRKKQLEIPPGGLCVSLHLHGAALPPQATVESADLFGRQKEVQTVVHPCAPEQAPPQQPAAPPPTQQAPPPGPAASRSGSVDGSVGAASASHGGAAGPHDPSRTSTSTSLAALEGQDLRPAAPTPPGRWAAANLPVSSKEFAALSRDILRGHRKGLEPRKPETSHGSSDL